MKFVADVMLGKLAKRLRLLGHDVLYDRTFDDNDVVRISLEQDRIILTRDTALAHRPLAKNNILILYDDPARQLQQVASALGLPSSHARPLPLSRCSVCNSVLVPAPKKEVRDLVPDYVYERQSVFSRCAECGRVYWKGTHTERMDLPGRERKTRRNKQ